MIEHLNAQHEVEFNLLRGFIADERRIAQGAHETIRNHEQHIDNLNMRLTNGASELLDAQHVYNASVSQTQALSVQLREMHLKSEEDTYCERRLSNAH